MKKGKKYIGKSTTKCVKLMLNLSRAVFRFR